MNLIYKDFGMLTGQTVLPPNQPTSLKVKNVHNFGIFQPIWLKLGTILEINIRTLAKKVHLLTRKVHKHVEKRLILCMSALGIDHCLHSAWH